MPIQVKRFLLAAVLVPIFSALFPALSQAETLSEIYTLAEQYDALIHAQEASYQANRDNARIARSALLPQISFEAAHSETDIEDHLSALDYDSETDTQTLTASQTLFNLEYWHNYRSGQKLGDQAEAQYRSDRENLVIRVVQAYTDVLNAIDNYKTAQAEEAALARQLDQTRQRFEVGLAAITDVYESQASFDNAHVNVLNAKGAVGIAFEALDTITGQHIESVAPLLTEYPIENPEPYDREEWVNQALANNADLKASEFARDAALQHAKAKRAGHFPTLTAVYQKGDTETESDPFIPGADADRNTDVLSINFNLPLFAGGGITASRHQAWQQYLAALEQYNYLQRSTVQAARSYHLAVTTGVARVQAQEQALVSTQSALDATNAGYEAGTRNIVDVLNAERALYNAQRLWHQARYQFIKDLLQLKKISGQLDAEDINNTSRYLDADAPALRREFE